MSTRAHLSLFAGVSLLAALPTAAAAQYRHPSSCQDGCMTVTAYRDHGGRTDWNCGGITYGESDREAAYPASQPVSPADLAATIYESLGIAPETRIPDPVGRPVPLVDNGRVLSDILT